MEKWNPDNNFYLTRPRNRCVATKNFQFQIEVNGVESKWIENAKKKTQRSRERILKYKAYPESRARSNPTWLFWRVLKTLGGGGTKIQERGNRELNVEMGKVENSHVKK